MPHSFLTLFSLAVIAAACAIAGVLGGSRERTAACAVLLSALISMVVEQASATRGLILLFTGANVLLLAVLMGVAWRARRVWTVCAVGLQGLMVAIDGLRVVESRLQAFPYLAALTLCAYALTGVIAYAGWAAWRKGSTP